MKDWTQNKECNLLRLNSLAWQFSCSGLAKKALQNEMFVSWSGSSYPQHHHYGDCGLLQHTREVVDLCIDSSGYYTLKGIDISMRELFLSALFHDYGKIYDHTKDALGAWGPTPHKRHIHHISRSAMCFYNFARESKLDVNITDRVLHNILSHHDMREFGSPVAPNSKEAWILCLCDQMSARVNDVDTCDILAAKGK